VKKFRSLQIIDGKNKSMSSASFIHANLWSRVFILFLFYFILCLGLKSCDILNFDNFLKGNFS